MKKLITIQDLYKSYGLHQILSGLTLDVYEAETLVILGRSGVGKSVLLRLILGLEMFDRGSIEIDASIRPKEGDLGMLFQSSALFDSLTIGENILFALQHGAGLQKFGPLSAEEKKKRALEALELVGLEQTFDQMPADLSGGMKRRVALARLLVYRPKILLYDEPTSGLDPITSMHISELIVMTQRKLNATSIVVTHDLPSALCVGERLALHEGGKIAYIAPKKEFLQNSNPLVQDFLQSTRSLTELLRPYSLPERSQQDRERFSVGVHDE